VTLQVRALIVGAGISGLVCAHALRKAGVNALQLKHALSGERVKATEMLLKHYPELKSIADPIAGDDDGLPLLSMSS